MLKRTTRLLDRCPKRQPYQNVNGNAREPGPKTDPGGRRIPVNKVARSDIGVLIVSQQASTPGCDFIDSAFLVRTP